MHYDEYRVGVCFKIDVELVGDRGEKPAQYLHHFQQVARLVTAGDTYEGGGRSYVKR